MNTEQNHGGGTGIKPDRPVDPASRTPILTVAEDTRNRRNVQHRL